MRVLGVDPGSRTAGFGILEKSGNAWKHISSGTIQLDPDLPMGQRLAILWTDLSELIQKFEPDQLALESLFFAKNASSAFKLGQARGVVLAAAAFHKLDICEYSPSQIKLSVAGSGRANKDQIDHMIRILLRLPKAFKFISHDHSDALAIALTHVQTRAHDRALEGKTSSKTANLSTIECSGVGYEVAHSPFTAEKLIGAEVSIHIYTNVKEDAIQLFGFSSVEERSLFKELLKVSNVGPKLALGLMSGLPLDQLLRALRTKDLALLNQIPGIGKKTAERLVLEMADRLKDFELPNYIPVQGRESELESVLLHLGYQKSEITRAIARSREATSDFADLSLEAMVKKTLGELGKSKVN